VSINQPNKNHEGENGLEDQYLPLVALLSFSAQWPAFLIC